MNFLLTVSSTFSNTARLRVRRQGVRRRGPELLPDAATFNARVRGHRWFGDKGIGIQIGGGTVKRLNLRGGIRLPPGAQVPPPGRLRLTRRRQVLVVPPVAPPDSPARRARRRVG